MQSSAARILKSTNTEPKGDTVTFNSINLEGITGVHEKNTIRGFPATLITQKILDETKLKHFVNKNHKTHYDCHFDVIISTPQMSFRTQTKNLSPNGLELNEQLPAHFLGTNLDIILIHKFGNVNKFLIFKGRPAEEKNASSNLNFLAYALNSLNDLCEALVNE